MTESNGRFRFSDLWAASLRSARINFLPGVILWAVGLTVVLMYYFWKDAKDGFVWIAQTKKTWGFYYSAAATAFFGGLIPFLYLRGSGKISAEKTISHGLFFIVFWGAKGVEVDALYQLQAWVFGSDVTPATIATKVAVDQFLYCPLWSAPVTALFYAWKDADFCWAVVRERFTRNRFLFEVAGVLLSIWVVWIPGTAIIYSLPLPLQIPLFNLVLCFYVLLISALGQTDHSQVLERAIDR